MNTLIRVAFWIICFCPTSLLLSQEVVNIDSVLEMRVKEPTPKIYDLRSNMLTFQAVGAEKLTVLDLLPPEYKNTYDSIITPAILSLSDPPNWSKVKHGQVVYIPLEITGKYARKYKIYGKGDKGQLSLILTSGF